MDEFEEGRRDTSATKMHIAKRAEYNEEKLEEGCRLIEKERLGLKAAARRVGVVKGNLQKYWNVRYKHYDSQDDEDSESDEGAACVKANEGVVSNSESASDSEPASSDDEEE